MRSSVWQLMLVIPLVIALKCLVRAYLLGIISQPLLPALAILHLLKKERKQF